MSSSLLSVEHHFNADAWFPSIGDKLVVLKHVAYSWGLTFELQPNDVIIVATQPTIVRWDNSDCKHVQFIVLGKDICDFYWEIGSTYDRFGFKNIFAKVNDD
jgi:hypothetical protein